MTNFDRRPRGRNNSRRSSRRNYGARNTQVIKLNDSGRSFNSLRNKFNGNATKLFDKYKKLASEALSIGDKILAESYFQHADHFTRILNEREIQRKMSFKNKDLDETTDKNENRENKKPVKVASLSGFLEKLVKPSIAKENIFFSEYFVAPANRGSLTYLTLI